MTVAQAYQEDVRSLRSEILNTILKGARACDVKLVASRLVESGYGDPYPRQVWYFDCPGGAHETLCTQIAVDEASARLCVWVSREGAGAGDQLPAEPFNHSPAQRAIWAIIQEMGCSD
jgi:hypothetical protein